MAYGSFVLMRDLNFTVNRGDIFIIMGGSGCGKSTLLKQMVGLKRPAQGQILYDGVSYWDAAPEDAGAAQEALRHPVPERRPVELHDPGGERRHAPGAVHPTFSGADRGSWSRSNWRWWGSAVSRSFTRRRSAAA